MDLAPMEARPLDGYPNIRTVLRLWIKLGPLEPGESASFAMVGRPGSTREELHVTFRVPGAWEHTSVWDAGETEGLDEWHLLATFAWRSGGVLAGLRASRG